MKKTIELPVEIGAFVYEADCPRHPQRVIGYRIGRMMGEDEEEFEEEGYEEEGYEEEGFDGESYEEPADIQLPGEEE